MNHYEITLNFNKVFKKLDDIEKALRVLSSPAFNVIVNDRENRFVKVLDVLGEASAEEVAAVAGCSRAYASSQLNELVRRGVVCFMRRGKVKVFKLIKREEDLVHVE